MLTIFWNNRTKRYYAQYTDKGAKHQFSCGTSNRKKAERYAFIRYQERIADRRAKPSTEISLTDLRDEFGRLLSSRYSPRSLKAIWDSFNQLQKRIGNPPLSKISVRDMERFIYSGQPSIQTSAKHFRTLRAVFNKAVKWKLIESNPFLEFEKPMLLEHEADFFSENEFQMLIASMSGELHTIIRLKNITILGFETGMRLGELLHLTIENIRPDDRAIDIKNSATWRTKSGRQRVVPISERAFRAITVQAKTNRAHPLSSVRDSEFLFPNRNGQPLSIYYISAGFKEYCNKVFPKRKLHFHSLRHSMAHRAFLLNVPILELQQILGHSTILLTEHYGSSKRLTFPVFLERINEDGRNSPE